MNTRQLIMFTSFFLLISNINYAQTINDKLEEAAKSIISQLNKKNKDLQIAIYPFTSLKKNEENLSIHIHGEFYNAMKLLAGDLKIEIMDRGTLDTYLAEHELNANALIDKATAKQFGKLIAVDGYLTAKIYKFGSVLNFQIKVTHTETGKILAYHTKKMPIDYDMAEFLELKDWQKKRIEAEENKSQNNDCESLNFGDYCFKNNTRENLKVKIQSGLAKKHINLLPTSKNCFKDLQRGSYSYTVIKTRKPNIVGQSNLLESGFFTVKKCESRLQSIGKKQNTIDLHNTDLITITIYNPNYYSRKVLFINKNNQEKSIIVNNRSSAIIQIPKGIYTFLSQTTFTKTVIQETSKRINSNIKITLIENHYN